MGKNRRRDYGAAHIALKKRLMYDLERNPGQPCSRCGRPMWPGQNIHLDHDDNGDGWLGLAHAGCNLRAGQQQTTLINRRRNALRKQLRWGQQQPYSRW